MAHARKNFNSDAPQAAFGAAAPTAVESLVGLGLPALLVWRIVLTEAQPAGSITLRVTRSDRGLAGIRGDSAASSHVFTFGVAGAADIQAGDYQMLIPLLKNVHGFGALPADQFVLVETQITEGPATLADCTLTVWRVPAARMN